jgi:hypothetical protein
MGEFAGPVLAMKEEPNPPRTLSARCCTPRGRLAPAKAASSWYSPHLSEAHDVAQGAATITRLCRSLAPLLRDAPPDLRQD